MAEIYNAFQLWKRGYDVWLWNARGNMYSREHVNPNISDEEFYRFSIHELGVYDTTAMIDYVLNVTGFNTVAAIGHSLGTSNTLVAISMRPEYKEKISVNIIMAQTVFVKYIIWRDMMDVSYTSYERWLNVENSTRFFLYNTDVEKLKQFVCYPKSVLLPACLLMFEIISGPLSNQGNKLSAVKMLTRIPTGSSLYVVRNMVQNIRSGKFKGYNWGPKENLRRYGSRQHPQYDLSKVKMPTAIYYGCCNDYLSSVKDTFTLRSKLPNVIRFQEVPYKRFNHGDFLWAKNSYAWLYKDIMELIDHYSGWGGQNKDYVYEGMGLGGTGIENNKILKKRHNNILATDQDLEEGR